MGNCRASSAKLEKETRRNAAAQEMTEEEKLHSSGFRDLNELTARVLLVGGFDMSTDPKQKQWNF